MRRLIRQSGNKMGFTIVEILTVMSIIVILIGLLVPALNMAKRYATDVKQQAQFHGIDVAMQLFYSGFEGYPDSDAWDDAASAQRYPGAARLCEAMVGQDLLGFHPDSHFWADCTIDGTNKIYDNPPDSIPPADLQANLQARKGPYLQLEKANAYRLEDIYETALLASGGFNYPKLYVLCDEYTRVKNRDTGKKIGMPILYYKADTSGFRHDANNLPTPANDQGQIYNYLDNDDLVALGIPPDGATAHLMHTEPQRFYESTKNEKITIADGRPYRADSYILISAGFDGQYGTRDDIFDFEP
jgi:type II secretory pathway pseudopilin PulG